MDCFIMETPRIGFSKWKVGDLKQAQQLWGDPDVTQYICASGVYLESEIQKRLYMEVESDRNWQVQYWPLFTKESLTFIGCCGLRHVEDRRGVYELGYQLRKECWGNGYAQEAAEWVVSYAFSFLHAKELRAGHHPKNGKSKKILEKIGFQYIEDSYYSPTGLYHPTYSLNMRR